MNAAGRGKIELVFDSQHSTTEQPDFSVRIRHDLPSSIRLKMSTDAMFAKQVGEFYENAILAASEELESHVRRENPLSEENIVTSSRDQQQSQQQEFGVKRPVAIRVPDKSSSSPTNPSPLVSHHHHPGSSFQYPPPGTCFLSSGAPADSFLWSLLFPGPAPSVPVSQ